MLVEKFCRQDAVDIVFLDHVVELVDPRKIILRVLFAQQGVVQPELRVLLFAQG